MSSQPTPPLVHDAIEQIVKGCDLILMGRVPTPKMSIIETRFYRQPSFNSRLVIIVIFADGTSFEVLKSPDTLSIDESVAWLNQP